MRIFSIVVLLTVSSILIACQKAPVSRIRQTIQPYTEISHPLYFWEEIDGISKISYIPQNTSNIIPIKPEIKGLIGIKASGSSTYFASSTKEKPLVIARKESDRDQTTIVEPQHKIRLAGNDSWQVTKDDRIILAGSTDDGKSYIIILAFKRTEPEYTPDGKQRKPPVISYTEQELYYSPLPIRFVTTSPDTSTVAFSKPVENNPEIEGLYLLREGETVPTRISDYPLSELGGFSPDGKSLVSTFDSGGTVELFIIDAGTGQCKPITSSVKGYKVSDPVWHPSGKYILYSIDYTSPFREGDTLLSGEQLFLYSIDSRNARRLSAFKDMTIDIDFAPNGDFLLYTSRPGVFGRGRKIGNVERKSEQPTSEMGAQASHQSWNLYSVPWVTKDFVSYNQRILKPDEMRLLVSWTIAKNEKIGFAWGPG